MHTSEYGASARQCSEGGRMCAKMIRTMFVRSEVVRRHSDMFADVQMSLRMFVHVCGCSYMFVGVIGLCGGFPLHCGFASTLLLCLHPVSSCLRQWLGVLHGGGSQPQTLYLLIYCV
jgi:hypothetical protein